MKRVLLILGLLAGCFLWAPESNPFTNRFSDAIPERNEGDQFVPLQVTAQTEAPPKYATPRSLQHHISLDSIAPFTPGILPCVPTTRPTVGCNAELVHLSLASIFPQRNGPLLI